MTHRPKRPCSRPGCSALVDVGTQYCDAHRKVKQQAQDSHRGTSSSRGYDADWRRLRETHLSNNPLCVKCKARGFIVAGTDVDHIIAFDGKDDPLRLDPTNLQTLCKSCHSKKTIQEDGGYGHGS
jgi:5-methylcytosine-specific restriction enzyme A